jgi:hypothetical protein
MTDEKIKHYTNDDWEKRGPKSLFYTIDLRFKIHM